MKVKFKRPAFIGGTLYEADRVYEIPEEVFAIEEPAPKPVVEEVSPRPGMPKGAIILKEDAPVDDNSSTPKQAPGTKDFKGTLIGREGYERTGMEPQQNDEEKPEPPPIPDELGDDKLRPPPKGEKFAPPPKKKFEL